MAQARQYIQDSQINNGTTASSNIKMTDVMPIQHTDVASNVNQINKVNIAQTLCEPFAVCNSNNPANGAYTATCSNFPDFALSYTDSQGQSHTLIGMKVRVVFNYGITYGSVSGGTYPTLNINGSGAIPLLAQGKTMATGAVTAEQTVEFTVIPYRNGLAYDADSNIRESTSDYTIYTDGLKRVDTVENDNKNMVTSNAVSDAIKQSNCLYDKATSLSEPQWVKICTFGFRNYGSALELECYSNFANTPQGCHIIKIAYGWTDITVEDIAKDVSVIFDKVRICWNSNNNDRLALFVHYNLNVGNTAYFKIKGTSDDITKVYTSNADPTIYSSYKEFKLGISGLTVNGQNYVNKIQGNVNKNSEVTVTFDAYRTILSLISDDEVSYCVLLLDQYRTSPLVIYGTMPSYITITHTQYSQEIKIKNTSNSYLVYYNIN